MHLNHGYGTRGSLGELVLGRDATDKQGHGIWVICMAPSRLDRAPRACETRCELDTLQPEQLISFHHHQDGRNHSWHLVPRYWTVEAIPRYPMPIIFNHDTPLASSTFSKQLASAEDKILGNSINVAGERSFPSNLILLLGVFWKALQPPSSRGLGLVSNNVGSAYSRGALQTRFLCSDICRGSL